jgi:F-box and WD-40 domain protein CDC4
MGSQIRVRITPSHLSPTISFPDTYIYVFWTRNRQCIYVLHGHLSTIRSLRVLNHRPIAVTGSRDATLHVWDVQRGRRLRVLEGHQASVRCLDVFGDKVVSGSYDHTCRVRVVEFSFVWVY